MPLTMNTIAATEMRSVFIVRADSVAASIRLPASSTAYALS